MLRLLKLKHLQLKVKKLSKALLLASELSKELLNSELVKEYKKSKELIDSNDGYKRKDLELRELQKEIINNYSEELVEHYKQKKDEFLNDPLVSNYLNLKEQLNNLLNTLASIINDNL